MTLKTFHFAGVASMNITQVSPTHVRAPDDCFFLSTGCATNQRDYQRGEKREHADN